MTGHFVATHLGRLVYHCVNKTGPWPKPSMTKQCSCSAQRSEDPVLMGPMASLFSELG